MSLPNLLRSSIMLGLVPMSVLISVLRIHLHAVRTDDVAIFANANVLILVDAVVGCIVHDVVACAARVSIVIVSSIANLMQSRFHYNC